MPRRLARPPECRSSSAKKPPSKDGSSHVLSSHPMTRRRCAAARSTTGAQDTVATESRSTALSAHPGLEADGLDLDADLPPACLRRHAADLIDRVRALQEHPAERRHHDGPVEGAHAERVHETPDLGQRGVAPQIDEGPADIYAEHVESEARDAQGAGMTRARGASRRRMIHDQPGSHRNENRPFARNNPVSCATRAETNMPRWLTGSTM